METFMAVFCDSVGMPEAKKKKNWSEIIILLNKIKFAGDKLQYFVSEVLSQYHITKIMHQTGKYPQHNRRATTEWFKMK